MNLTKVSLAPFCVSALFITASVEGRAKAPVVVDSLSRAPLGSASVFDRSGRFIGISSSSGGLGCAKAEDYPLTIRYMGYHEKVIPSPALDTIFMAENVAQLREVVVETKKKRMLHILAYVREHSALSSYTDTVTMFREKMVDFMLPTDDETRYRGWRYPRTLNSRSYYRFSNAMGLDSVSNRCNHHFSWSDWVGMFPTKDLPDRLRREEIVTDTISGKYSPIEIWSRNGDKVNVDINVLADTVGRRWVPNIKTFFRNSSTEFERFRLRVNYNNVIGDVAGPQDLNGYSFNIESQGRGRDMFMFNRHDQPFFVTTYTEVYLLDKEYIPVKEAKKWSGRVFETDEVEIFEPMTAPPLHPSTLALIDRVNRIDDTRVRLSLEPDKRMISRNVRKRNFDLGTRALTLLKDITGITAYKARKNFNRKWRDFSRSQTSKNAARDTIPRDTIPR